jgi:hypothetical protein
MIVRFLPRVWRKIVLHKWTVRPRNVDKPEAQSQESLDTSCFLIRV